MFWKNWQVQKMLECSMRSIEFDQKLFKFSNVRITTHITDADVNTTFRPAGMGYLTVEDTTCIGISTPLGKGKWNPAGFHRAILQRPFKN